MRSPPKSINLQPQDPNLITGTAEGGRSAAQTLQRKMTMKLFVDYAGESVPIVDASTGEII